MSIGVRQILKTIFGSQMGLDSGGSLVINKNNGGQLVVDGTYLVSTSTLLLLPRHNGRTMEFTVNCTVTVPVNLPKDFTILILIPSTGVTVTLSSDGVALLNGATANISCAGSSGNKFSLVGLASAVDSYLV